MPTVISIVGTFKVGQEYVGQTDVGPVVRVPAVYRPQPVAICGGGAICADGTVCGGVAGTLFGSPTFFMGTVSVLGVPSAQAFTRLGFRFQVFGVPSAQAFGRINIKLQLAGVPSAQQFGIPEVYNLRLHIPVCDDLTLAPLTTQTLDLVPLGV
jgi:hypothetical protein